MDDDDDVDFCKKKMIIKIDESAFFKDFWVVREQH